jgi:hypothetical protein
MFADVADKADRRLRLRTAQGATGCVSLQEARER